MSTTDRKLPSVGDKVFNPMNRMHGVVTASAGEVTVTWSDGSSDPLTFAQFAIAFEFLAGRWELI